MIHYPTYRDLHEGQDGLKKKCITLLLPEIQMIFHTYFNIIIPNLMYSQSIICHNKILYKIVEDYSLILECYSLLSYCIRLPNKIRECYCTLPNCTILLCKILECYYILLNCIKFLSKILEFHCTLSNVQYYAVRSQNATVYY